ncbi:MAG: DNA-3-methyladenine glycosylase 2 [Capsulimonadales bacterium]|nr:DNA-3-methyladenine glycosylase 2 [Capsulimonadales bacterium]
MELTSDACYQALQTHDRRFDGVFFVGVATTGIYCRPVCPARTPLRRNCRFFDNAAAAEKAGFRPCLRCRPELAPGRATVDAGRRLAERIAGHIEDGALSNGDTAALAAAVGIGARHLRRVIQDAYGVAPVELAQTHRLLLAKRLLTDTDLPVTEVAFASGFRSLRRFNALFRERYRLNPTELRRQRGTDRPETLTCELRYLPPFDWPFLTRFLAGRASCGTEAVVDGQYRRTVRREGRIGWLTVDPVPDRPALRVTLSTSLAPVTLPVLTRVRRLFDLHADPDRIVAHLGAIADASPGLRVPGAFDGFEMAVRAILGQQVSVRAASTLSGRFARAFGEEIVTPYPELTHLFPTPETVAGLCVDDIARLGIFASRATTLLALARAVTGGVVTLEPTPDIEPTVRRLRTLPGIGEWTAEYIALRALCWPDAFPHGDLGIQRALGETKKERLLERADAWRPFRSYAVLHLWKSLEENETK